MMPHATEVRIRSIRSQRRAVAIAFALGFAGCSSSGASKPQETVPVNNTDLGAATTQSPNPATSSSSPSTTRFQQPTASSSPGSP